MGPHYDKLAASYSPELVAMVRSCLDMDPLARPQSVFALQKVLQTVMPAPAPSAPTDKLGGQWRALVERVGAFGRKKTNT
jgi:hypothetical protein